jgi:hypothetical protein
MPQVRVLPVQGDLVLQQTTRSRGLPKRAEVIQDIAICGLGYRLGTNFCPDLSTSGLSANLTFTRIMEELPVILEELKKSLLPGVFSANRRLIAQ